MKMEPKGIERTILVTRSWDLKIHGELFLAGLVCGEEVLSSGCSKVTPHCDSTGDLAWYLAAESLALSTGVALRGHLTRFQLVHVLSLFQLKDLQSRYTKAHRSWCPVVWVHKRSCLSLKNWASQATLLGSRRSWGQHWRQKHLCWSPAVPACWQWNLCLAAFCAGALCLLNTTGAFYQELKSESMLLLRMLLGRLNSAPGVLNKLWM